MKICTLSYKTVIAVCHREQVKGWMGRTCYGFICHSTTNGNYGNVEFIWWL